MRLRQPLQTAPAPTTTIDGPLGVPNHDDISSLPLTATMLNNAIHQHQFTLDDERQQRLPDFLLPGHPSPESPSSSDQRK